MKILHILDLMFDPNVKNNETNDAAKDNMRQESNVLEPKIAYELKTGVSGVNQEEANFILSHVPLDTKLKEVHVKKVRSDNNR